MQDFQNEETGMVYPELKDKWALLVAASTGWNNYRHQADIFAIYQRLKLSGYDDDHIVLIAGRCGWQSRKSISRASIYN